MAPNFACAAAQLEAAYSTLRQSLGDADPRTRTALELEIALYRAWGRPRQEAAVEALLGGEAAGEGAR